MRMNIFNSLFISETKHMMNYGVFENNRIERKVSFSSIAEVILIPCLNDYKSFSHELWYSNMDYDKFKSDYINSYFSFYKNK